MGVLAGGVLIGAKLIEIVIARDLLELVRSVLDRVLRVDGIAERGPLRGGGFGGAQQGTGARGESTGEQRAAAEIGRLRRDLRRGNVRDAKFHRLAPRK